MEYSASVFIAVALSLLASLFLVKLLPSSNNKKHPSLPPSPPSLPILGHLHLLKKPLHRTLARLSSHHRSPVLLLRFGSRPVIVVSSLALAEECFAKNDIAFASRPQLPSVKSLSYNYTTLSFAPYGPHWRNVRRIATVELLSTASLQSLSDIRYDEVKSLMHDLLEEFIDDGRDYESKKAVELRHRLFGLAYNVMMRMIAGKRSEGSEEARRFKEVVEEGTAVIGASNLSDFLPALRAVDFGGVKRRTRWVDEKKDAMLQRLIDEQKRINEAGTEERGSKKKCMLEVLLDFQQESPEYYSDEIIKAMIVTLFFAGTETSTVTMEWAMTLLVNHPEILQKARDEIDSRVGNGRLLQESDLQSLTYLQAIVSETLRLRPAAPMPLPHESVQECTVGGYRVPRGTMLLVNAWAIYRDPGLWSEPGEFRPERFLDDVAGKTIPFGMGRRRCPGDGLATRVVGLAMGTMIQCFEWERTGDDLVDMGEAGGLTLRKASPLRVMYWPRQAMIPVLSQT